MKSSVGELEEPAVVERRDVGRARLAADERHLAEEVARPEPDVLARDRDLDLARRDEVGGVRCVAAMDHPIARLRGVRLKMQQHDLALLGGERPEHREVIDQFLGRERAVRRGPLLGARARDVEVGLDLRESLCVRILEPGPEPGPGGDERVQRVGGDERELVQRDRDDRARENQAQALRRQEPERHAQAARMNENSPTWASAAET